MGRPIGVQNKDKPFRDALRMEAIALANGDVIEHPKGSLRWNAQQLLMRGEPQAIREIADRLDGKVPQAVEVGSPGEFADLDNMSPDELRDYLVSESAALSLRRAASEKAGRVRGAGSQLN